MNPPLDFFRQPRPVSAIIAFALSYALMVQGIAFPTLSMTDQKVGPAVLCLSGSDPVTSDPIPIDKPVSHSQHAPCCLIFGSGDMPRLTAQISSAVFHFQLAVFPALEFRYPRNTLIAYRPSLPRAPPLMGSSSTPI